MWETPAQFAKGDSGSIFSLFGIAPIAALSYVDESATSGGAALSPIPRPKPPVADPAPAGFVPQTTGTDNVSAPNAVATPTSSTAGKIIDAFSTAISSAAAQRQTTSVQTPVQPIPALPPQAAVVSGSPIFDATGKPIEDSEGGDSALLGPVASCH